MLGEKLKLAVGIATTGRREILARTIDLLACQTLLPDRLVICPVKAEDVDLASLERFPAPSLVVTGASGLPAQRNRILSTIDDADIVVFFDDDFFATDNYLKNLAGIFTDHLDVVAVTGFLLADGAKGPGLNVEQGLAILRAENAALARSPQLINCYGTYGCNMAFRLDPIRRNGILFDENLPLYGWQEDIDFSLQIAPYGRTVKSETLRGVHLGVKLGRTSGVRFGYSQIANPIYLIRKGTMSRKHAKTLMWHNLAANFVRSFHPEPWVDRKGRLKGNVLALTDMVSGRISPRRILQLD
jgi:succinoglycan biosynthesis transport protein ExoP